MQQSKGALREGASAGYKARRWVGGGGEEASGVPYSHTLRLFPAPLVGSDEQETRLDLGIK